ncbi:hypothetical protein [Litoribacillus peritrichatus]|uniref:Uncharacterized protein n=1 Tax=Litoribacillus peritrichatus TaxID=718191 RepID=A0ABP7MB88_9GAMM
MTIKLKNTLIALSSGFLFISTAVAVEGYPDVYLDREQTIYIQGMTCGDFNKPNTLKPSAVYSNSKKILTGTYYFSSKYGNFSYTFAPIEGQPAEIMKRGLLTQGETSKDKMKIDQCLVGPIKGLPPQILKNLQLQTLAPNDLNWGRTMEQYAVITGRPAFSAGNYQDPRLVKANLSYDQQVYDANQAYKKALEVKFNSEFRRLVSDLPKKVEEAILYARQEDGFIQNKQYPVVEKPEVWTATSERRYNDQLRSLQQMHAWDNVIQNNFDWLHQLVGKEAELKEIKLANQTSLAWNEQSIHRTATVAVMFDDGKTLELDFTVKSEEIDESVFESLETIKVKSERERQSMIVKKKEPRVLQPVSDAEMLTVYSPTEKVNLFFSPFRDKKPGDSFRYY